ncbi:MAG: OsmC family protein [Peptococcaceae bacterium]|nr:OsmC family protein [Peptococcaceae bacterium]
MEKTAASIVADPANGKRKTSIEGVWNLSEGQPQFSADIAVGEKKFVLEADQPPFAGGAGTRPGPMHYALFGLASCFTATFASIAAMEGITLQEVRTSAEFDLNFAKVFGLSDDPIVEEVRVLLTVRSNASGERIEAVMRLAEERCPASFCLKNPIRLVPSVRTE